ncbi:hypothetical protein [Streptomyces sp. DSM 15324]|uniref:hypothetical protein n=1 Tax=Streptomyces sp. DSM 15324 TaxID=1739111 RepID=UPI00074ADA0D|nr:hypothetical protein [Streptomyces sp. DSM 15324]KUO12874.1 hypothetical protein AQJ58_06620 [Streptomyces sp. DSM 15324]
MRTLRKAGLVAAMIGTLTLTGAGVASAGGSDGNAQNCTQTGEVNVGLVNLSKLNLGLGALLGLGSAEQDNGTQFSCINGNGNTGVQADGGEDSSR